jgi:protein associated with RNAse G/E
MKITVEKRKPDGSLVTNYVGELISRDDTKTILECRFNFEAVKPYVSFCLGDRSVETFYHDRWYHIVELHSVDDDLLKGWYCNLTLPPTITERDDELLIVYIDLAIDVFVNPRGDFLILDEEELDLLKLDPVTQLQVWFNVEALRRQVSHREIPFNEILSP